MNATEPVPLVYIILINWNGIKDTQECLESLSKVMYKKYNIIVVDNGSENKEGNKLKTKYKKIHLIQNSTNKGFSEANNQGIRYALSKNADYVLLLNNDTVVDPLFLAPLVQAAQTQKELTIISSKILYYRSNKIWAMGGSLSLLTSIPRMIGQGEKTSSFTESIYVDYAPGCVLLLSKTIIKRVGLLDSNFFAYYEDTDYCFRAKRKGIRTIVIPESIVWHKVSQSTRQSSSSKIGMVQSYLLAKNGIAFGDKNFEGFIRYFYFAMQVFVKTPLYLLFKTENFQSAKEYLRGVRDGLTTVFTR